MDDGDLPKKEKVHKVGLNPDSKEFVPGGMPAVVEVVQEVQEVVEHQEAGGYGACKCEECYAMAYQAPPPPTADNYYSGAGYSGGASYTQPPPRQSSWMHDPYGQNTLPTPSYPPPTTTAPITPYTNSDWNEYRLSPTTLPAIYAAALSVLSVTCVKVHRTLADVVRGGKVKPDKRKEQQPILAAQLEAVLAKKEVPAPTPAPVPTTTHTKPKEEPKKEHQPPTTQRRFKSAVNTSEMELIKRAGSGGNNGVEKVEKSVQKKQKAGGWQEAKGKPQGKQPPPPQPKPPTQQAKQKPKVVYASSSSSSSDTESEVAVPSEVVEEPKSKRTKKKKQVVSKEEDEEALLAKLSAVQGNNKPQAADAKKDRHKKLQQVLVDKLNKVAADEDRMIQEQSVHMLRLAKVEQRERYERDYLEVVKRVGGLMGQGAFGVALPMLLSSLQKVENGLSVRPNEEFTLLMKTAECCHMLGNLPAVYTHATNGLKLAKRCHMKAEYGVCLYFMSLSAPNMADKTHYGRQALCAALEVRNGTLDLISKRPAQAKHVAEKYAISHSMNLVEGGALQVEEDLAMLQQSKCAAGEVIMAKALCMEKLQMWEAMAELGVRVYQLYAEAKLDREVDREEVQSLLSSDNLTTHERRLLQDIQQPSEVEPTTVCDEPSLPDIDLCLPELDIVIPKHHKSMWFYPAL